MKIKKQLKQALICTFVGAAAGMLNPAYALGRIKGYDIREAGSKNPGASNVLILEGRVAGALVMAFDVCKAALAVRLGKKLCPDYAEASETAGTASIFGHIFSPLMRFRGGKGLACLGGTVLALSPRDFAVMLLAETAILGATRYLCLVPISASVIYPVYRGVTSGNIKGAAILGTAAIPIILKHRENLERIKQGREFRIDFLWDREGELERTGWISEA